MSTETIGQLTANIKPHDIFVIKIEGLPLFALCSCGLNCKKCADQHDLQAGFISAIVAFCQEVFSRSTIKAILLDDLQLNIHVDTQNNLIFAVTHSEGVPRDHIRDQLNSIAQTFVNKYHHYLEDDLVRPKFFENFGNELLKIGILPSEDNITSILAQQQLTQKHRQEKPRLWKWLKKTLNRTVKLS